MYVCRPTRTSLPTFADDETSFVCTGVKRAVGSDIHLAIAPPESSSRLLTRNCGPDPGFSLLGSALLEKDNAGDVGGVVIDAVEAGRSDSATSSEADDQKLPSPEFEPSCAPQATAASRPAGSANGCSSETGRVSSSPRCGPGQATRGGSSEQVSLGERIKSSRRWISPETSTTSRMNSRRRCISNLTALLPSPHTVAGVSSSTERGFGGALAPSSRCGVDSLDSCPSISLRSPVAWELSERSNSWFFREGSAPNPRVRYAVSLAFARFDTVASTAT
jgi:hypothetical protein